MNRERPALMNTRLARAVLVLGAWLVVAPPALDAAVIVLANRTGEEIAFTLTPPGGAGQDYKVPARDLISVPTAGALQISFAAKGGRRSHRLDTDMAYYFGATDDGPELKGIGPPPRREGPATPEPGKPATAPAKGLLKISVKLFVDQAEPLEQEAWEPRLRKRVAAAAEILERQCRVKLEVESVGTWESDNRLTELNELLRDFEEKVKPKPARLAIGFTSQRFPHAPGQHLGAIRRPLSSHLLAREWFPRTETERLEVLVHELGHFLGATHSPEDTSAMRPNLGDGRALRSDFPIGADPLNALVMNLVADDLRGHEAKGLGELSRPTRERLAQLYGEIGPAIPKDHVAEKYLNLLGLKPRESAPPSTPLVK
jgi:hypothetical protein